MLIPMLHSKHIQWCWSKEVYFIPLAINPFNRKVIIAKFEKGELTRGKIIFDQNNKRDLEQLYKKINELYAQVYKKNNKIC